jgi:hypothetical protein
VLEVYDKGLLLFLLRGRLALTAFSPLFNVRLYSLGRSLALVVFGFALRVEVLFLIASFTIDPKPFIY